MNIDTVIIPAAGYGTRFLPYTKAMCKEFVPLIDKPIIHHIVQEAVDSGCTTINMVTNKQKKALEQYFTYDAPLHALVKQINKEYLLADIHALLGRATFNFFNQEYQHGVAHAIMQALPTSFNDFFAIMYPDDIVLSEKPALLQLAELAREHRATIIAVTEVPQERIGAYGVIAPRAWISDRLCRVERIVEKPSPDQAPSCWAVIGRFIAAPELIPVMHHYMQQRGPDFLFTDALEYCAQHSAVYAYRIEGTRHDTGTPEGWLEAVVDYASRSTRYRSSIGKTV